MLIKLPGLIDVHVHLREFGATHKEDFYTGTCAALAGGYVAVIDMPNNPQPTVSLKAIIKKEQLAVKKCVCDYGFHFGANNRNWQVHPLAAKKTFGIKLFMNATTGPLLVEKLEILKNHFQYWPKTRPIMVHAEDSTLATAIGLAMIYDKWLHVCHLNQASELDLVKKGRKKGAKITCETAPHYLFLTEKEGKELWPFSNMRPPLATKKDVKALWQGINDGSIDFLANDHAPHTIKEKKSKNPPCGVPGLETTLALMLTAVNQGKLSLKKLTKLTSTNPAEFLGIKLNKDTWIEVDMNKTWKIRNQDLFTKCGWSLFNGWKVKGKLMRVFMRGKKVFEDGRVLAKKGWGKLL
jgi:dihydroorotase